MKPDARCCTREFPNNILAHTTIRNGNYEEASREPGLIKVEGWYDTPTVQHCHIENHMCFASMGGRAHRHLLLHTDPAYRPPRRRAGSRHPLGQGTRRQATVYRRRLRQQAGRCCMSRCAPTSPPSWAAASSSSTARARRRSSTTACATPSTHIISWVRPDGTFAARESSASRTRALTPPTATASSPRGMGAFPQLYPCPNVDGDAYTVFTNRSRRGAMRGYGIPAGHVRGRIAH